MFINAALNKTIDQEKMFERVSVFGITSLPRFHIEMLMALSEIVSVNLFLMNPCNEYWGDILSKDEIKKTTDKQRVHYLDLDQEEKVLHIDRGNRLLAR